MHATECGTNAEALLDELDAFVEVAAAEEHVIEDVGDGWRALAARAKRERTGEGEERTARESGHVSSLRSGTLQRPQERRS
jgi:hypothetical protein